jgi:hypothetical protein
LPRFDIHIPMTKIGITMMTARIILRCLLINTIIMRNVHNAVLHNRPVNTENSR